LVEQAKNIQVTPKNTKYFFILFIFDSSKNTIVCGIIAY